MTETPPPRHPTAAAPPVRNTVLVVDDTASKRYVLASWLRRGGYSVVEAATGTAALERVAEGGIDLVVLDVRLPDMSGFDVCEAIKAGAAGAAGEAGKAGAAGNTPVIHVSAAAIHAVDRTHGLERGADAYLVEPIDPNELLATVASILRYYQARIHAETLARRLENLARVGVTLGAMTNQRALLHEAARGATRIFHAPVAIVSTGLDGNRVAAISEGPDADVELRAATAALPGEGPIGVTVVDQPATHWPQLTWPTDTLRVLTIRPPTDRPPLCVVVPVTATMEGAPVLTLFAQAVMAALDSVRLYHEEHDLALTLQRSMLPRTLPSVSELEIAVRYTPASERAEIGGDFYEVARLDDHLMIAVGDVGGHSLHAATVMAEVRHATRAYIAEGHGPATVLDRLNDLMALLIPGEIATMCLLSIELSTGRTQLANAGHPPPLISGADGVRLVTDRSPLLGMPVRAAVGVTFDLQEADTVVLYTDGLIETRREPLDTSLARLTSAAAIVEDDLETFANRLLSEVGPSAPADDIAMVVVRRRRR